MSKLYVCDKYKTCTDRCTKNGCMPVTGDTTVKLVTGTFAEMKRFRESTSICSKLYIDFTPVTLPEKALATWLRLKVKPGVSYSSRTAREDIIQKLKVLVLEEHFNTLEEKKMRNCIDCNYSISSSISEDIVLCVNKNNAISGWNPYVGVEWDCEYFAKTREFKMKDGFLHIDGVEYSEETIRKNLNRE